MVRCHSLWSASLCAISACHITSAFCRAACAAQRAGGVEQQRAVMCHSKLITRDVEGPVKDAKNVDVSVVFHEVRNAVMPIQEDSDVARGRDIAVSDLGKALEDLCSFVDSLNRPSCCNWIIGRDVLEDVLEPTLRFLGPCYFCHDRMRCAISSLEIVRFASASARP